jgi:hypothetical protein
MNPFDQLIRLAEGRPFRPALRGARLRMPELPAPVRSTKSATLIAFLQEGGPASTSTLSSLIRLESRLVWGLLKAPRERGQVRYADGMWSATNDYDGELQRELSTAAALLRRHGWTVRPPEN